MKKIWLINFSVFICAFLLFQIELILSKILLFQFGGTFTVWGAALVFFQGTLLLGYMYSHFMIKKVGVSNYRYFHLGLLFITLFFFPGRPLALIHSQYGLPLTIDIFWQLAQAIGLVFFTLSTMSIIFQSWIAESNLEEKNNPYALYAVSNLGSFAGILTYPIFFESLFDLKTQLNIWRITYFIFLFLQPLIFKFIRISQVKAGAGTPIPKISILDKANWLLISMAGVMICLSVTNIITFDITPLPLLWILPLCVYLASFVLVFKKNSWCIPNIRETFYISVSLSLVIYFLIHKRAMPALLEILVLLGILFIVCMFCQKELFDRKPTVAQNLTAYYLFISLGGFLGGMLVSWVMPLISTSMIEFLISLYIILITLLINEKKELNPFRLRLLTYGIIFILLWPKAFHGLNIFGIILLVVIFKMIFSQFKEKNLSRILSLLFILFLSGYMDYLWSGAIYTKRLRNYYAIYKVFEKNGKTLFLSGNTVHGAQNIAAEKELEPLAYFHRETPVGKILPSELFDFKRVGIIGLGTGTLAAYGKTGQEFDFFELDPDVLAIAEKYFTYLKKSKSKINHLFGDARISLAGIPDKRYDLFIVDAFSGDSIPVHLLTTEAIKEYLRCASDNAIVLFHISNRFIRLEPVLFRNAQELNVYACYNYNPQPTDDSAKYHSVWFALTKSKNNYETMLAKLNWLIQDNEVLIKGLRPWTDQYSNVLRVFNIKEILRQLKDLTPRQ